MSMKECCGLLSGFALSLLALSPKVEAGNCDPVGLGDPCTDVCQCPEGTAFCEFAECSFDATTGTDICKLTQDDQSCSAGAGPCFGVITCDPTSPLADANGCVASGNPCNDNIPCTVDTCAECTVDDCTTGGCDVAECSNGFKCTNTPNNDDCSNGSFCDGVEVCDPIEGCQRSSGNPCFPEACDETTDSCFECQSDSECDDGLFCNGAETCFICVVAGCGSNRCMNGTPPCDDGIDCTVDDCDESTDACGNTPDDSLCPEADADLCTPELCDPANGDPTTGCRTGDSIDCTDAFDCTLDACDPATGVCTNDPDPDYDCSDGLVCNGLETCDPDASGADTTTGCAPGTPVDCTPPQFCSESFNGQCVECETTVTAGSDCDDGFSCTSDSCNAGVCEHDRQDFLCADLAFCNGAETCDPTDPNADATTGCIAGTTPECDPGFFCSLFCDSCVVCEDDSDCDDGNACNGIESCQDDFSIGCASTCVIVTPAPICDDGYDCTIDTCLPSSAAANQFTCSNTPSNAICDNGLACDGAEVCDPVCVTAACQSAVVAGPALPTGCFTGRPPTCDDAINCTDNACKECTAAVCAVAGCSLADCARGFACTFTPNDTLCNDSVPCTTNKCDPPASAFANGCVFTPDDAFCDDDLFCNGKETCDENCTVAGGCTGTGCISGEPPSCNDGIVCTADSCDEQNDECVHQPIDDRCSDRIGCNGQETCAGGGCPTPVLCCFPGQPCQEYPDIFECENDTVAGGPPVPLCFADGCLSAICCHPANSICTEDPVAPDACLGAAGIPICSACESVVCCSESIGGVDCDTGVSPADCVDSGRIPACGDCLVRCCFIDTAVAGDPEPSGCIDNMPLDLCSFFHGKADCDGCENGTPPDCADDLDCTIDSCREGEKLFDYFCDHTPDHTICDDGIFCNGEERCVLPPPLPFATAGSSSGCQSSPPPVCPKGTTCDACIDGCAGCLSDAECIDSDPCTADGCVLDSSTGAYVCVNKNIPACTPPTPSTTTFTQKGSLLIFSKIEIKWDNDGNLLQDTFLSLYNDDDSRPVEVQAYFINGDVPLEEVCMGDPCVQIVQEQEPGWNTADCRFTLTKSNPISWSAARGGGNLALGGGNCQPFTVLDDSFPPGRPDPENGMRTRILRGYVVLWAIALNECVTDEPNGQYQEIRWNDLTGEALIVNYERGYAWDYRPWAFQAHGVEHGEFTGTPGVLNLDGIEYDAAFARLLLDFQASGSQGYLQVNRDGRPGVIVTGDTDLTLHPVPVDLRQDNDGPLVTKAEFSIFNEFEAKFSGTRRCIQCWDQRLVSHYTASGIPNHFNRNALGTDAGVARIEGLASTECNGLEPFFLRSQAAPLLGVSAKVLSFGVSPSIQEEWAGTNLFGVGVARAAIRYDLFDASGELLRIAPAKSSLRSQADGALSDDPKNAAGTR